MKKEDEKSFIDQEDAGGDQDFNHFNYDEQGLIQTPSDDREDFTPGAENEGSLGNLDDDIQSQGQTPDVPGEKKVKKSKKDKKEKKSKKDKKDKKDKKEKKDKKRHLTRPSVKEEDLPPVVDDVKRESSTAPADETEVVGKKRRMKRNIIDDEEEEGETNKKQKTQ